MRPRRRIAGTRHQSAARARARRRRACRRCLDHPEGGVMNDSAPALIAGVRDGVAWITFNRPQKANALTIPMLQGLEKLLGDYAADDSVRAVVLTAAGTRTFSAGADLTPAAEDPEAHRAQRRAQ